MRTVQGGDSVEVRKDVVRTQETVGECQVQVTLEDDFNVPDAKPDLERVVTQDGRIELLETNLLNGKILIKGILHFELIYISMEGNQRVHSIQGKIPFDEIINMDGLEEMDQPKIRWKLEDINCSVINSRKISVKALLQLMCSVVREYDCYIPVGIEEEQVERKYNTIQLMEQIVSKKDIVRARENFRIPGGKPNVGQIVTNDIVLKNLEFRGQDEKILVRGEIRLVSLYRAQDSEELVMYDGSQPFYGTVDCVECRENREILMNYEIQAKEVQLKADEDGEDRTFEVEIALGLDFSILEEKNVNYLEDVYSVNRPMEVTMEAMSYKQLVKKQVYHKRISQQSTIALQKNPVGQICFCRANVQLEEKRWEQEGLKLEGTVDLNVVYVGEEKEYPLGEFKISIPFSFVLEDVGEPAKKELQVEVTPANIEVLLQGKEQVEAKIELDCSIIIFKLHQKEMITGARWSELEKKEENYGNYIGYRVQEGDDLWSIAKKYGITRQTILECNKKNDESLQIGEKILIVCE